MSKKLVNPEALFDGAGFGMSQATVDTTSGLVFVAGQIDWNHQFETTENTVEGQLKVAFKNLKLVLEEAGSSIEQLMSVRVYIRGEFGDHMEVFAPIIGGILGSSRPAVTAIGVASLASPETLVEIEAVASVK